MKWGAVLLTALLALAGCGKKGDLLPPPGYGGAPPQDHSQK